MVSKYLSTKYSNSKEIKSNLIEENMSDSTSVIKVNINNETE